MPTAPGISKGLTSQDNRAIIGVAAEPQAGDKFAHGIQMDINLLSNLISDRIERATMPADTQGIALDVQALMEEHGQPAPISVVTQLVAYSIRIQILERRKHDNT